MAIASGARTQLTYVKEVTMGVTPGSPAMKILRTTGRNINLQKNMLQSSEIRPDRQVADVRHGFNQVSGSIPFELGLLSYDDMLESALSGTWTAIVTGTTGAGLTVSSAADTITRASGSWITQGFRPGDIVFGANFTNAGNNNRFRVLSVTATVLTLHDPASLLVTEGPDADATMDLVGKRVDLGADLDTYSFERGFLDVAQFQVFAGVAINTMNTSIQPERMVNGTFGLVGMSSPALSGTSLDATPDAAPLNSPFSAFEGVLYEGTSINAVVTGLDFTLDNGRVLQGVIGSKFSPAVFEGTADVTGTLTAFFENSTMFNKFINETETSVWIRLDEVGGTTNFLNYVFPRIKFTGGDMDPPQEGPVPLPLPFRALVSSGAPSMSIQRSNV